MQMTRRDFLARSAAIGAAVWAVGGLTEPILKAQSVATTEGAAESFAPPGEFKVKYHGRFWELPVGSVKARGWIHGWLERQLSGLTGHPENMAYRYDTCMYGGKIPPPAVRHGEIWWRYEQSGYFVDGAVRLGLLLDDPAAAKIPAANLEYILANSGPRNIGGSIWGWPNAVVGRALMAEFSGTGNIAAARVLMNYLAAARAGGGRDAFVTEEALYVYGLTGSEELLQFARDCYQRLFVTDPKSFSLESKIRGASPLREHGVTAAEQLKLLPLLYSYTGDKAVLELASLAYGKIVADSLMPDGGIVSSESLGTAAFNSLHETCDLTDWPWSLGYMLMAGGEGKWGDVIERCTFNALPGAVTRDFKQLQYFSSPNQVLASSTACPRIAMTRMSYRAAHDTECCSGNVNRAMPNYVTRMWMREADGSGVAAVLYGPCELHTTLDGEAIGIVEETDYPFRDTITFTVKLARSHEFTLSLRIPGWCEKPEIVVNGKPGELREAEGGFTAIKREFRDGDVVTLRLPMEVAAEDWFGGRAVVVRRGALVYAMKIGERRVESSVEPEGIRRVLHGNNVQGFPAVEFFPKSEWRYGMDQAVKQNLAAVKSVESPMPENPFLADKAPVKLAVPLRAVKQWAEAWKPVIDPPPADLRQSPKNPAALPTAAEMQARGEIEMMEMIPYGCTHLRLTTLPVIPEAT